MSNDLFKKLKRWERDDKDIEMGIKRIEKIEGYRTLTARLNMLLGAMVTALVVCITFLIAHGFKVI